MTAPDTCRLDLKKSASHVSLDSFVASTATPTLSSITLVHESQEDGTSTDDLSGRPSSVEEMSEASYSLEPDDDSSTLTMRQPLKRVRRSWNLVQLLQECGGSDEC